MRICLIWYSYLLGLFVPVCITTPAVHLKQSPYFSDSYSLQYISLHNSVMLHVLLYTQLNEGIGRVTQYCHLMVRSDGIGSLELLKKSLLFYY